MEIIAMTSETDMAIVPIVCLLTLVAVFLLWLIYWLIDLHIN